MSDVLAALEPIALKAVAELLWPEADDPNSSSVDRIDSARCLVFSKRAGHAARYYAVVMEAITAAVAMDARTIQRELLKRP